VHLFAARVEERVADAEVAEDNLFVRTYPQLSVSEDQKEVVVDHPSESPLDLRIGDGIVQLK
jgi:hypothetical protein